MKIAVKDANVLIDMAVGGLLESWFQLDIQTCTTDIVWRQVLREEHLCRGAAFRGSRHDRGRISDPSASDGVPESFPQSKPGSG